VQILQPQETSKQFKISVRFAEVNDSDKKENWKYTLAPYKEFFNNYFEDRGGKHLMSKNTDPILAMAVAYCGHDLDESNSNSIYGQRGYTSYIDFNDSDNGHYSFPTATDYTNYAGSLKKKMNDNGFERVMFWSIGGYIFL